MPPISRTRVDGSAAAGTRPLAALLVLTVLSGACDSAPGTGATSSAEREIAIPHPVLDGMEPAVAGELESQRAEVDRLLASREATDEQLAAALGSLGRSYLAHRLVEAAEACFREAQGVAPEEFAWAYYLGVLAARRGDFETAAAAFDGALAVKPRDHPALIRLAGIELDRGSVDSAAELYQRALAVDSASASAEYGLGRVAAARQQHQQAVEHFTRALELQPQATVIQYHLGQSYRGLQQFNLAEAALADSGPIKVALSDPLMSQVTALAVASSPFLVQGQAALRDGRLSVASRAFRRAIESDPENPRAYQSLAGVLKLVRDFRGAAEHLEHAARLDPGNPQILYDLASARVELGDDDGALEPLLAVVELDPNHQEARLALADTLARLGRREEAERNYRLLLEIDPGHVDARSRLGTLLSQAGATRDGIAELERAVSQDPLDAQVRLNLGIALARTNDLPAAIEQHRRVLELTDDAAMLAHANSNLGTLYLRSDARGKALQHFLEVLRHDDAAVEAHLNAGNLLAGNGRLVDSLPHFERVRSLAPGHPAAWLSHATALVHLGQVAEAMTVLEETIDAQSENPDAMHALARVLAAAPEASQRDGRRALSLLATVLRGDTRPLYLETRAMALAEAGQFDAARNGQAALIEEMRGRGGAAELARLERNLQRYSAGQACCAEPRDLLPLAVAGN